MTKISLGVVCLLTAASALLAGCADSADAPVAGPAAGPTSGPAAGSSSVVASATTRAVADHRNPRTVLEAAIASAHATKFVHIYGTGRDHGAALTLDVHFGSNGFEGSVTTHGTKIEVRRIDSSVYMRAPDSFWRAHLGTRAAAILPTISGKWVEGSSDSPFARGISGFFTKSSLVDSLDEGLATSGKITRVGSTTIDGAAASTYRDSKDGSVLAVTSSGRPYLLRVTKPGAQDGGTMTYSEWGQAYSAVAPSSIETVPLG